MLSGRSTILAVAVAMLGCAEATQTRFTLVPSSSSNVLFNNVITETEKLNYFNFPYIYMGGGVSVGDVNNDGLPDVYFTGNMVSNRLYLNKGAMIFQDISEHSGAGSDLRWSTGSTMVDVNGDGFLDIYVCVSGPSGDRSNQLFINNQDLTFSEEATKYGLDHQGPSIQSVFFDYDNDNDLDVFIANYPATSFRSSLKQYHGLIEDYDSISSDFLFENRNGVFYDVSKPMGIANFGLSLGVIATDFDKDGWVDIYVSNDFATPDRLFMNQKGKGFGESLTEKTFQTSFYGMGMDAADFDNDSWPDFMQLDMDPEDNRRSKENMSGMDLDAFEQSVDLGFHYQYMHNVLQRNNGSLDQMGGTTFSNISRLAGVSSTDWSWSALFADLDNDGWKDLFITNGTRRDIHNRDFFTRLSQARMFDQDKDLFEENDKIPFEPLDNYVFRNERDLTFRRTSEEWGLTFAGFSNGASYADLDKDGDLDLVVNNIDSTACIFRNNTREMEGSNYVSIEFDGPPGNLFGLGAKVTIETKDGIQYGEHTLSRGFQSSVSPGLHFGLLDEQWITGVEIKWPDGEFQRIENAGVNQTLRLRYEDATTGQNDETSDVQAVFKSVQAIDFQHQDPYYNDFKHQPLLPHKLSQLGPPLAKGDINSDGRIDVFVGGAAGSPGVLFQQKQDESFQALTFASLEQDKASEDVDAVFFDADGDGDLDLYVARGSYEFEENDPLLADRIYFNEGEGSWGVRDNALPEINLSSGCVAASDYDSDGDVDLFVGGRLVPRKYPQPSDSYLLVNDGGGQFQNASSTRIPESKNLGMVTDAHWDDVDSDGDQDLLVVGEWMAITVFENEDDVLKINNEKFGTDQLIGWWNTIEAADLDNDGDTDYFVGNLGNNYKYQATADEPFEVFAKDFDRNGSLDIVLSYYNEGILFPVRGRSCSIDQIPNLEFKFSNFRSFAVSSVFQVYEGFDMTDALHLKANTFSSGCLKNNAGVLEFIPFPNLAQISSINSIVTTDVNQDGFTDLILAGNLLNSESETPRNDASLGLLMTGNADGTFQAIQPGESGVALRGEIKKMISMDWKGTLLVLAAANNGKIQNIAISDPVTETSQ